MTAADARELDRRLDGEVLTPASAEFESARRPFVARYDDLVPEVITRCASAEDIAAAIDFARRHGLHVAVRGGGHCYAGRSSTTGVLIDLAPMDHVRVADGAASIGAGARLGTIYEALLRDDVTIAGGSCPTVGIAGLTLGGGLGILGRRYGLTCDRLLAARVVLADGSVVDCDADHLSDLFWGLRGGGAGRLGVVTSLTFEPVPAPTMTNFRLTWTLSTAASLVETWQRWAPDAPDELAASLLLRRPAEPEEPPTAEVIGAMVGTERDTDDLLAEVITGAGSDPVSAFREQMSYRNTRRFWDELASVDGGPVRHEYLQVRSEFFRRPLDAGTVAGLVADLTSAHRPGQQRELDFSPWGGAYNRVPTTATAFAHRDERFLLKVSVDIPADAPPEERTAARSWLRESATMAYANGSGRVFPNFADPELDDWSPSYHGENRERLLEVKAAYDPDDLFHPMRSGRPGPPAR